MNLLVTLVNLLVNFFVINVVVGSSVVKLNRDHESERTSVSVLLQLFDYFRF